MRPSALAPAAALALLALTACGDARRLATGEGGGLHGLGWAAPTAHGAAARRDLASCKGCHGTALTGALGVDSCDACHAGGAAWRSNCTFCHGDPARGGAIAAAPPRGTRDEALPGQPAVGAHLAHVVGKGNSAPVACTACHRVPADLSHVDGVRQVVFSGLAAQGGASPVYAASGSCSATYCHGAIAGGFQPAPAWTGPALACSSCHGAPPTFDGHQYPSHAPFVATACPTCHGTGYSTTSANPALHVNGVRDVVSGGIFTWDPGTRTCNSVACHSLPPATRNW